VGVNGVTGMDEPEGFRGFVVARSRVLLRAAWLLTGDGGLAQDLVQVALAKTWPRWKSLDAPELYVRRAMVTTYLTWRRRRWLGEVASPVLPEVAGRDEYLQADLRQVVQVALSALPRRQRAVLVLRYFEDLREVDVAKIMGCSVGTVKSQTAKAIVTLRRQPALAALWREETIK